MKKRLDRLTWLFVAGVLGYSALDKLVHYGGFVNAINDYRILPLPLGWLLAPLVIALELGIAVGLCKPSWRGVAALQSVALMVILSAAWLANRSLGSRGICGCWFSINMPRDEVHLAFNLILIILSCFIWWGAPKAEA